MNNVTSETPAQPAPGPDGPEWPNTEKSLNGLNEQQMAVIELLVLGQSYSTVAKNAGIGRRTLYRWRQEEAFAEQLAARRQEIWSEAADRMRAMVTRSLDVMEEQLGQKYDRSRVRA